MKTVIISLGGSIIVPDNIDIQFLKDFKLLIEEFTKKDYRFIIYCGGGMTARTYQKAAAEIVEDQESLDWIGISATHLNAFLLRTVLYDISSEQIVKDPTACIESEKPVILAAGWKPGWSTDYDAVLVAKKLGTDTIINMSNIDYVYDSDPKKNPDAKPLKEISWSEFCNLVGNKWTPGLNMPFDPIAAKEAEEHRFKVIILGKDIDNLRKMLSEEEYKGTLIH